MNAHPATANRRKATVASRPNVRFARHLPATYETKKKDAVEAQALDETVVYVFDIPVALLNDETGFRYDDWLEAGDVDAFRLVAAKPVWEVKK